MAWLLLVSFTAVISETKEVKGFLRNFAKFTWKHPCQNFFFNKVAGPSHVFLWVLQNFQEYFFYRTPLGDWFYNFYQKVIVWSFGSIFKIRSLWTVLVIIALVVYISKRKKRKTFYALSLNDNSYLVDNGISNINVAYHSDHNTDQDVLEKYEQITEFINPISEDIGKI